MSHEHRWDKPWRGRRRCRFKICRGVQYQVGTEEQLIGERIVRVAVWRDSLSLRAFAEKWLPAVSGTRPQDMMSVKVAYPFEWNSYESWNIVFRVRFDFTDVTGRTEHGLGTRVDVMNGWQSKYAEDFCRIDVEAEAYYRERTGREYDIGDNTYFEMRQIIQSPVGAPKQPEPPSLTVVHNEGDQ